jgi:hypothetical protein
MEIIQKKNNIEPSICVLPLRWQTKFHTHTIDKFIEMRQEDKIFWTEFRVFYLQTAEGISIKFLLFQI